MKNYDEILRLIMISYNGDIKFAINHDDIIAAQDAIVEVNNQQIGFGEYLKLHEEHLSSKGCSVDAIKFYRRKIFERLNMKHITDVITYILKRNLL